MISAAAYTTKLVPSQQQARTVTCFDDVIFTQRLLILGALVGRQTAVDVVVDGFLQVFLALETRRQRQVLSQQRRFHACDVMRVVSTHHTTHAILSTLVLALAGCMWWCLGEYEWKNRHQTKMKSISFNML